ncbi:hypothetical protein Ga0466249_002821 [Sporomusaceae bacterium BoRhaA]|uniref:hypothetical protein n=1 Tax=Pelorhabdus rhamnosifermentans TaxID=2772457 RepID=UPI001C064314|nr:hypothetical protein [Pelorhabdus rhamnosifermentans]MBU2701702.1 hypothetical protein [Pelorhabdus rhamnosifermentans]
MNKIQQYLIEAIVAAFMLLFLFWAIGYWGNALYGMKFELKSCWDGFTTLGGAGVLAMIKYIMDSWKNSDDGKNPYQNDGGNK